jgi:hypothetical protein
MNARTHSVCIGLALGVLAGCSGGDGSSPDLSSTVLVAGHWSGTLTDPASRPKSAWLFADESGEFQLHVGPPESGGGPVITFSSPIIVYGNACCQAQIETAATANKLLQTTQTPVQLSLNIQAGRLTGAFEFEGRRLTFDLTRSVVRPSRLTLSDLAGVYSGAHTWSFETPKGWTLTIQNTGAVTGADDYGCNWLGTASIANTDQNMFQLDLDAQGCAAMNIAPANGKYRGMGLLGTNPPSALRHPGQQVIEFNLVGPMWFGQQMLAR